MHVQTVLVVHKMIDLLHSVREKGYFMFHVFKEKWWIYEFMEP